MWNPRVGGEKLKHPKYTTDEGGDHPRMGGEKAMDAIRQQ